MSETPGIEALRLAREGGRPPATWVTDETAPRGTLAGELHQFRTELDAYRGHSSDGAPAVKFESAADLLKRVLPQTPWLVRGLLVEDGVMALAGEPKTFKTFGALDMGLAVATGTRALAQFDPGSEKPRPVAAFLAEDSPRSVRARLSALARGRGLEPAEALKRLHVQCRGAIDIGTDQGLCSLGAAVRMLPEPISLLILDPFRDLHRGEEDKSGDMSHIMGNLRALRTILGCSVLFVHHMSKSTKDTGNRRTGQRMRGSSAIHGAVDGTIGFSLKDSIGGTTFTNSCDVELKAAKGAGRFVLKLELRDDPNGEVEHAKWTYEAEEIVVPEDGVYQLEQLLHVEWTYSLGKSPSPITKSQLRARMHKSSAAVDHAVLEAERRGLIRQMYQGRKSVGYLYVPPEERPSTAAPSGEMPTGNRLPQ